MPEQMRACACVVCVCVCVCACVCACVRVFVHALIASGCGIIVVRLRISTGPRVDGAIDHISERGRHRSDQVAFASQHITTHLAFMAGKKSALTAALNTGAPAAPVPLQKPQSSFRPVLDNYAFPCLQHAPDDGTPVPDLSELVDGLESIDLKSYTVVGSAPTRTSLPNGTPLVSMATISGFPSLPSCWMCAYDCPFASQADFPLDPYHRRGGKEVAPFSFGVRACARAAAPSVRAAPLLCPYVHAAAAPRNTACFCTKGGRLQVAVLARALRMHPSTRASPQCHQAGRAWEKLSIRGLQASSLQTARILAEAAG